MIFFRADGGNKIGIGHIMRLMTIADSVRKRNKEVLFVLADTAVASLVKERDFTYKILDTKYDDMEGELPKMLSLIEREKPETIFVDSYFVTDRYLSTLKKQARTIYMDDVFSFDYEVDVLINYNIYAWEMGYELSEKLKRSQLLLGCEYMPLRSEFLNMNHIIRKEAKNIMISTGGSDSYGIAEKILWTILSDDILKEKNYHVICSSVNTSLTKLKEIASNHKNISLHVNEKEMPKLMQEMDVAVSAGGSTMYELAAVGVPTICFSFADNQKRLIRGFTQRGIARGGYDFIEEEQRMLQGILRDLQSLIENPMERGQMRIVTLFNLRIQLIIRKCLLVIFLELLYLA